MRCRWRHMGALRMALARVCMDSCAAQRHNYGIDSVGGLGGYHCRPGHDPNTPCRRLATGIAISVGCNGAVFKSVFCTCYKYAVITYSVGFVEGAASRDQRCNIQLFVHQQVASTRQQNNTLALGASPLNWPWEPHRSTPTTQRCSQGSLSSLVLMTTVP